MSYVDGFLIALPAGKIDEYQKIAHDAGKVWLEHGALDYKECIIDDGNIEGVKPFAEAAGCREGETVIFSFIVYESRQHRDEVNAKVMADDRIKNHSPETMPFDCKRMYYGGFKTIVEF